MRKDEVKEGRSYVATKEMAKGQQYHTTKHISELQKEFPADLKKVGIEDIEFLESSDKKRAITSFIHSVSWHANNDFAIEEGDAIKCVGRIKCGWYKRREKKLYTAYTIIPKNDTVVEHCRKKSEYLIYIHDHRYFEESDVDFDSTGGERQLKADRLKYKKTRVENEISDLELQLKERKERVKALKIKIENLEKFSSDEEAFAHRIAKIMNESGGDKEKIQKMVEDFGGVKSLCGSNV